MKKHAPLILLAIAALSLAAAPVLLRVRLAGDMDAGGFAITNANWTASGVATTGDVAAVSGTPMAPCAWVSTNGADNTAIIGNPLRPYRTMQAAWDAGASVLDMGPGYFAGMTNAAPAGTALNISGHGTRIGTISTASTTPGANAGALSIQGNGPANLIISNVCAYGAAGTNGSDVTETEINSSSTVTQQFTEGQTVTFWLGGTANVLAATTNGYANGYFVIGSSLAATATNIVYAADDQLDLSGEQIYMDGPATMHLTVNCSAVPQLLGMVSANFNPQTNTLYVVEGTNGQDGGDGGAVTLDNLTVATSILMYGGTGGDPGTHISTPPLPGAGGDAGASITLTDVSATTASVQGDGAEGGEGALVTGQGMKTAVCRRSSIGDVSGTSYDGTGLTNAVVEWASIGTLASGGMETLTGDIRWSVVTAITGVSADLTTKAASSVGGVWYTGTEQ